MVSEWATLQVVEERRRGRSGSCTYCVMKVPLDLGSEIVDLLPEEG